MGERELATLTPAGSPSRLHNSEQVRPSADSHTLPALIGLTLFVVAIGVLRTELRAVSWPNLVADILATPASRLAIALLLTFLNYAVLTGYDFLALTYIGKRLPRWRVAIASFLAYAVANSIGFGVVSGASVRYRFYTRWGITAEELARVVFSYSVTFWIGLLVLGGLSLIVSPLPATDGFPADPLIAAVGWLLLLTSAAYLVATIVRRRPIPIFGFELPLPSPRLAAGQLLMSTLDWTLAGAVLFALLPPSQLSFFGFEGAFLAAVLAGFISHVPGGVGVFEGLMIWLLKPYLTSEELLPSLVAYRALYFLLPLTMAIAGLAVDEVRQRRGQFARVAAALATLGEIAEQFTPRMLSIFTFLGGVLLLVSGATPAAPGRLNVLVRIFPLPVIELSHFAGSVVGATLLVLSQGLARRLDAAYLLATTGIAIGIAASLLKGVDYEEAAILTFLLLLLWRARPAFDRRAAFFETRFSAKWIAAVVSAICASVWLGLFAFKHVEYSHQLWWQFAVEAEASRFLRASVGAATGLLLFASARLIGPAPHDVVRPDAADLEAAGAVIAAQRSLSANLVYLRDKAVLFDAEKSGFVMYGVQGRTWISMGDPIGPASHVRGLIRLFLERADDFNGVPVFYEVQKDYLHHYADFGLTFVKLGEDAQVDLTTFTLDGGRARKFRQAIRRLEHEGGSFRIIPAEDVPANIDRLREISDQWLRHKAGGEKGFSLGFFDPEYLSRFPVAVVERGGRIQAFANLWLGPHNGNISLDLMRYDPGGPRDVMEALLIHLMEWSKGQGYEWFALGMAPLSGFETSPAAPLWNRLGAFLYEHGESLYNFHGLRAYKEKFNPVWQPRYLAYPGGLRLPRILADLSALVAGGYRNILRK